jgi:hypothetical protein
MAYRPLNLGTEQTSRESLDSALTKIDEMLSELYTTSATGGGEVLEGGSAALPLNDLIINGNDLSDVVDGGDADGISDIASLLSELADVDSGMVPALGQVLKFNGTVWTAANDIASGGTGLNADTLDGFPSSFYLDYANLTNTPALFSGDYAELTNTPAVLLPTRTTVSGTTASIANAATATINLAGFKGYVIYKIQTSAAAWIRLYTNVAARTADSTRAQGDDPASGAGVVVETISTGAQTIIISPGVHGFNDEATPISSIPIAVTNLSGVTAAITVTLTVLQIEA